MCVCVEEGGCRAKIVVEIRGGEMHVQEVKAMMMRH